MRKVTMLFLLMFVFSGESTFASPQEDVELRKEAAKKVLDVFSDQVGVMLSDAKMFNDAMVKMAVEHGYDYVSCGDFSEELEEYKRKAGDNAREIMSKDKIQALFYQNFSLQELSAMAEFYSKVDLIKFMDNFGKMFAQLHAIKRSPEFAEISNKTDKWQLDVIDRNCSEVE